MKRTILAIVVGLLLFGGTMAPASAESGTLDDPSGDAPARIDLTRLEVDNGNRWFTMRVGVRNLRQQGRFGFHYWGGNGTPPPRSVLIVVRRVEGTTKARFLRCGRDDCAPAPCPRMRVAWRTGQDYVRVSAPQACFPRPRNNPDAPAPARGLFFSWSQLGERTYDDTPGHLVLDRG